MTIVAGIRLARYDEVTSSSFAITSSRPCSTSSRTWCISATVCHDMCRDSARLDLIGQDTRMIIITTDDSCSFRLMKIY